MIPCSEKFFRVRNLIYQDLNNSKQPTKRPSAPLNYDCLGQQINTSKSIAHTTITAFSSGTLEPAPRVLQGYTLCIETRGDTLPSDNQLNNTYGRKSFLGSDIPSLIICLARQKANPLTLLLFALMKKEIKFLRLPQVKEITSLSRSSIYRLVASGDFPKQIPVGANQVVWVKWQVEEWMEQQIASAV